MVTAVSGRYNNTTGFTYDEAGRLADESLTIGGQTYSISNGYNAADRRTQVTYPDGTIVDQMFTARGQLEQVDYDGQTVASLTYDSDGRGSTRSYGNGLMATRAYRNDDRLSSIDTPGLGTFTYGYDANKSTTSESITGVLSDYGWTTGASGYDLEDRLSAWLRDDGNFDRLLFSNR